MKPRQGECCQEFFDLLRETFQRGGKRGRQAQERFERLIEQIESV